VQATLLSTKSFGIPLKLVLEIAKIIESDHNFTLKELKMRVPTVFKLANPNQANIFGFFNENEIFAFL
jgi:hypothetical protein